LKPVVQRSRKSARNWVERSTKGQFAPNVCSSALHWHVDFGVIWAWISAKQKDSIQKSIIFVRRCFFTPISLENVPEPGTSVHCFAKQHVGQDASPFCKTNVTIVLHY
jgi:hypothetical protein